MRPSPFLPLLVLAFATPAPALTITQATIAKGAVQVAGKGAASLAALTWQGAPVGVASKGGGFKFATAVVPDDCTATVSDGQTTAVAVIAGCTRVAPHMPVATVVDATGAVLGPYQLDTRDPLGPDHSLFAAPNGPIELPIRTNGDFVPFDGHYIFADYAEADCSGPPLVQVWEQLVTYPPLRVAYGVANGLAYYQPATGGQAYVTQAAGFFGADYPCPFDHPLMHGVCCCSSCAQGQVYNYAPMGTIDVGRFVPPFRVELR